MFFGNKTEGLLETPESFVDARVEGIHRVAAGGHVYIEVKMNSTYYYLIIPSCYFTCNSNVSTGENFIGIRHLRGLRQIGRLPSQHRQKRILQSEFRISIAHR
jgi:hypothetical protein